MVTDTSVTRARSARHYVLDGPIVSRLQTTIALAARALGFPMAMVNILDADTQHTISTLGVEHGRSIPREIALCDAVVGTGSPVVIERAWSDPAFGSYPCVASGEIGTYIGVPLRGRETLVVGALCVTNPGAQPIKAGDVARLAEFAKVVEDQLDLIRRLAEQRLAGESSTQDLARAIHSGEIVPWYQPVIDLETRQVTGFEALARWQHPTGAVEPPKNFVPLAEDSDLILELDRSVMRQALHDLSRWRAVDPLLRMNINVSGRLSGQVDWLSDVCEAADTAGVPPEAVSLELTETARVIPAHGDAAVVRILTDHGFQVWLDDFGTGWSSLDYLLRVPATGIKFGQEVSVALGTEIGNTLIRTMSALAQSLGLRTTIEGIETSRAAALAYELGCNFAQGYLWAQPAPASAIVEDWLHGAHQTRHH